MERHAVAAQVNGRQVLGDLAAKHEHAWLYTQKGKLEQRVAKLEAERDVLRARVERLEAKNKRLVAELFHVGTKTLEADRAQLVELDKELDSVTSDLGALA